MSGLLRALGATGLAGAAVALTLLLAAAGLALGGHSPVAADAALARGAFGTPDAVLSVTLVRAVPLVLTGLAVALAFRAGVWNIGAEGQLYAGALLGTAVGLASAGLPGWIHLPLSLGAAALWAALPALLRTRLGVGEVITTLVLNFVALHLMSWAVRGPLQEARRVFPQSAPVAETARLEPLWEGTRLHWGFPPRGRARRRALVGAHPHGDRLSGARGGCLPGGGVDRRTHPGRAAPVRDLPGLRRARRARRRGRGRGGDLCALRGSVAGARLYRDRSARAPAPARRGRGRRALRRARRRCGRHAAHDRGAGRLGPRGRSARDPERARDRARRASAARVAENAAPEPVSPPAPALP